MAVIVASSVKKNGNVVSGDITKIVVVRTNPGYGPNPSDAGTGTVVAVICVSSSNASLIIDRHLLTTFAGFESLAAPARIRIVPDWLVH
jgi:hypothetical protein